MDKYEELDFDKDTQGYLWPSTELVCEVCGSNEFEYYGAANAECRLCGHEQYDDGSELSY